mmetsp:Transcript_52646/g.122541  ORF Transcript_52646/g.122541 Transcript_52646/m.122541 type:complete len:288 (-) Transcript_52646:12-875(-)|eukprot:CAMPEP_0171095584 /NCGR_PEP_ID=MMETSP0766_2-20121228/43252_1 /TAXON_ID=439317 /ORGANISM="Gambierdiscus australes, Strain CAWD 149" /LENGTH=287 /DNA_ID=CAMNT_0011554405 /DNA_START=25 /DNA_END=888 /DNA_ORIENTATION=-
MRVSEMRLTPMPERVRGAPAMRPGEVRLMEMPQDSVQYQGVPTVETNMMPGDDCTLAADYCCNWNVRQPSPLVPCESMELYNDPRFFNDNVIDKRLTAFTALSIVSSLMAGAACDNFFPFLDRNMGILGAASPIRSVLQLVGFGLMCMVLFLNVVASMVFGVQFYFTYRLMTSGPVGFESARAFYLDSNMTFWRQFSAKALIWGMPMFVLSIGCMLFVKFDERNADLPIRAWVTLVSFTFVAGCLLRIGVVTQRTFNSKYCSGHGVRPLLASLESSTDASRLRYMAV